MVGAVCFWACWCWLCVFGLGGDDVFIGLGVVMGFGIGWLVCWSLMWLMDDEPESLILAQSERWRNA